MGNVSLNFSEEEWRIFNQYCTNYCHLYDETRKNTIKIFLELYQRRVMDIGEHSLENVFLFFYQKKQEAEIEGQIPGSGAAALMRLRLCTDIIAFLEDLEKIYVLLRKKGIDANYYLILGAFFKITDDEDRKRREDLYRASAGEINAVVLPLHNAIARKIGRDADTKSILCALAGFVTTFNSLSPDFAISDELMNLIGISLLGTFKKEEPDEEIPALIRACRDQAGIEDFECALEGKPRVHAAGDLDCSWDDMKKFLRILNERIVQAQLSVRGSSEVLSALETPVKVRPELTEYPNVSLSQYQGGLPRRRNDENRFLIHVESRPSNAARVSPVLSYISAEPPNNDPYKQYYTVTFGVLALIIMILATMTIPLVFSDGSPLVNMTSKSAATEKAALGFSEESPFTDSTVKPAGTEKANTGPSGGSPPGDATGNTAATEGSGGVAAMLNRPATPVVTPLWAAVNPKTTPLYVVIEAIPEEPDTDPQSKIKLLETIKKEEISQYNPDDYVTIYRKDMEYIQGNGYNMSFTLKNPPMIIHYTVIPVNITDVKWFSPRDAAHLIDTAVVSRPYENAWFKIKVYQDGDLLDEVGWGRDDGIPLDMQEIRIRDSGGYQIEFSGEFVKVVSEVLVRSEGNIDS